MDNLGIELQYKDVAIKYHAAGWSPLPMRVDAKVPFIGGWHGKEAGYPDANQVEEWATNFPGARLGLRLPKHICGIDIDVRHGGDNSLAELEAKLGPLSPTISSTARSDGSRIMLFRIPEGREWVGTPARGIDFIHAGNRYVVAWPSRHNDPSVNAIYRWSVVDDIPAVTDVLAELSPAWVEYCTRKKTGFRPKGDFPVKFTSGYQAGTPKGIEILQKDTGPEFAKMAKLKRHNNALYIMTKRIYELVAGGELDDKFVHQAFTEAADRLYDGWEEGEVEKTIEQGRHNGLDNPRTVSVASGEDIGFLMSGPNNNHIMSTKSNQQWSDFDIQVQG